MWGRGGDIILPILKHESGYGGLANMRNISYSCQSYCLTKELDVALLDWQIESSAITTLTAKVSDIALHGPLLQTALELDRRLMAGIIIATAICCLMLPLLHHCLAKPIRLTSTWWSIRWMATPMSLNYLLERFQILSI